jgi:hypothetical protein
MVKRRATAIVALLGLLASVGAPTVMAAPAVTTITIDVNFSGQELFTSGGLICPSGVAVTDPFMGAGGGRQGRGAFTFHLIKTLTCDDGSGWFRIKVEAGTSPTSSGTVGGFSVVDGTGAYASLHGAGSLQGTFTPTGILDVYTGRLSN